LGASKANTHAFKIDENTYVFGVVSDWYKMVAVDATGAKIECRYMDKGNTLNADSWVDATHANIESYNVKDVTRSSNCPVPPPPRP